MSRRWDGSVHFDVERLTTTGGRHRRTHPDTQPKGSPRLKFAKFAAYSDDGPTEQCQLVPEPIPLRSKHSNRRNPNIVEAHNDGGHSPAANPRLATFSSRELGTILVALLFWREEMAQHDPDAMRPYYRSLELPFNEPLSPKEVDALSRRLRQIAAP